MAKAPEPFCRECAQHHPVDYPHNAESLIYQLNFYEANNRPPSWDDAMAHCDDKMKQMWSTAIAEKYPDTSEPMSAFFAPMKRKEQYMNSESAAHIHPSERLQGEDALISDRKGDDNRVTLQSILDKIVDKAFYRVSSQGPDENGLMTRCILTMRNGFLIDGYSACQTREQFDKDLGEQLAFDNAVRDVYKLEAYLAMEKRFLGQQAVKEVQQAFPGSETVVVDDAS